MTNQIREVLQEAAPVFSRYDKARNEMREAELELRLLCRKYDVVSGCRGIRIESLRIAVEAQGITQKDVV